MMNFLVAMVIFGGCVFVTWLIYAIVNAVWEHKELAKREAHPQFYGWIAELNEKVSEEIHFHNNEIVPLKKEIDRLLAEQPYYTAEKQVQVLDFLEECRQALADRQYELKRMKFQSAKLRCRIREYNKEHNLESGWND